MSAKEAFAAQARACARLGSPFMGRMLPVLWRVVEADPGPVGARIRGWQGDISATGQSVPLRLAGALHALVLTGADAGLVAAYPPNARPDDALAAALGAALSDHADHILHWLQSAPQTNEIRRSAALIAGATWALRQGARPLVLSELGASAGLNLQFDAFALDTPAGGLGNATASLRLSPDWHGPVPKARALQVQDRAGVDLNPLDPSQPDQALRLLSYLWPDQPERAALTASAIAEAVTRPDTGDAAAWLEARLATPRPGALHLVYHTVAWQYFPPETAARCNAALEEAGARATQDAPLAHLSMEADETDDGAALRIRLWPGGVPLLLARVDFHGRWIRWLAA